MKAGQARGRASPAGLASRFGELLTDLHDLPGSSREPDWMTPHRSGFETAHRTPSTRTISTTDSVFFLHAAAASKAHTANARRQSTLRIKEDAFVFLPPRYKAAATIRFYN